MEVLTRPEAAKAAKLSIRTIDRLIARGELPAIRVGRSVRIRRETLRAVLEHAEVAL